MRRIVIAAVVLGGFWVYNNGYLDGILGTVAPSYAPDAAAQTTDGDPVVGFADDDPEMGAAMVAARATLPQFLANEIGESGAAPINASLKVAFPTADNGAEVIWVRAIKWDGDSDFSALLANQPNYMGDLNEGDLVTFTTDMVRDWAVTNAEGTMFGHYTTRVMVPQLDEQTQAALNAVLSPDPVPADWN